MGDLEVKAKVTWDLVTRGQCALQDLDHPSKISEYNSHLLRHQPIRTLTALVIVFLFIVIFNKFSELSRIHRFYFPLAWCKSCSSAFLQLPLKHFCQCWSELFELFEYSNSEDRIVVFDICIRSIFKTRIYSVFSIWSKFSIDTYKYSITIRIIRIVWTE